MGLSGFLLLLIMKLTDSQTCRAWDECTGGSAGTFTNAYLSDGKVDGSVLMANPTSFSDMTRLQYLSLTGNSLTSLAANLFDTNTALTRLSLYLNALTSLAANLFDTNTALTYLNLNDNDLTVLPEGVFDTLTELFFLYLNNNLLTVLPGGVFDKLTQLKTLTFDSSKLGCSAAGAGYDCQPGPSSLIEVGDSYNRLAAVDGSNKLLKFATPCSGSFTDAESTNHFTADCTSATAHNAICTLTFSEGYSGGSVTCDTADGIYDVVTATARQPCQEAVTAGMTCISGALVDDDAAICEAATCVRKVDFIKAGSCCSTQQRCNNADEVAPTCIEGVPVTRFDSRRCLGVKCTLDDFKISGKCCTDSSTGDSYTADSSTADSSTADSSTETETPETETPETDAPDAGSANDAVTASSLSVILLPFVAALVA